MSKRYRDLVKELNALGFEFDHTNSKGLDFYVHPDTGKSLRVNPGADERQVRTVIRQGRSDVGLPTKDNKRNPAQIRERNAAEHERAARELARAREHLDKIRGGKDEALIRAAEERYLEADRQFRFWDSLMRQAG